jgi:NedA-like, galactose-binding domain
VVSNYTTNVLTTAIVGPQTSVDVVDVVGGDTKINNGVNVRPAPDVPVGASFGNTCASGGQLSGESVFTKCNSTITSTSTAGGSTATTRKFLRVTRASGLTQQQFKAHWRTSLTVMQGIDDSDVRLKCHELTDETSPHDEIQMLFMVENVDEAQFTVSEWVDDGSDIPLAGRLAPFFPDGIRYVTNFGVQLIEMDDDPNDDDVSEPYFKKPNNFKDKGPGSAFSNNWSGKWDFEGGLYRFHYALSHRTPNLSPKFTGPMATVLSQGKTAIQSSTFSNWVAGLAVDGGASTAGGVSVSATNYTLNPWWRVDLGAPATIESVRIYDCTSGCAAGTSSNLFIDYWNGTAWVNAGFVAALNTPYSVIPMGNVSSQHVRVRKQNETNYLDLAEVQVWGTQP